MDYYRMTKHCYSILDTLGLNDFIMVLVFFLGSFLFSLLVLLLLKKFDLENSKKNIGIYALWILFIPTAFVIAPISFLILIFILCEHVVAVFLAAGLYAGVLKLLYTISETLANKLANTLE